MDGTVPIQIRHACRRRLGQLLSMVRLHQVEFLSIDDFAVVRKRRRTSAMFLIPLGNLFQRLTGSPVFALSSSQWLAWEKAIETATHRRLILNVSGDSLPANPVLVCQKMPGKSLRQILSDIQYSSEQKSHAVRLSLAALGALHERQADWEHGVHQFISHGDATVDNVIVDLDGGSACWIDFDTRHHPNLSQVDRQTDDIRSLIYSAAVHLPVSKFSELADILLTVEIDAAVTRHFRQRLAHEWIHLSTFQLAQAPLRWSDARALRAALLWALAVE